MNRDQRSGNGMKNVLVIAAILFLALALILASRFLLPKDKPTQEEIRQQMDGLNNAQSTAEPQAGKAPEAEAYLYIILNNRLWGIQALGEERDVTVDQGDGVVNVIHLLPDGFYMASSTCDNQLCVMEGTVTVDNYHSRILGGSVLCLPHGLDLELIVPSHTPDPNAPDI